MPVRPRCEIYSGSHKQAGTGGLKNTIPKRIALTSITLKNMAPKNIDQTSIALMNIGPTTRERETASVCRKEGIELSFRRVPRTCWTN